MVPASPSADLCGRGGNPGVPVLRSRCSDERLQGGVILQIVAELCELSLQPRASSLKSQVTQEGGSDQIVLQMPAHEVGVFDGAPVKLFDFLSKFLRVRSRVRRSIRAG